MNETSSALSTVTETPSVSRLQPLRDLGRSLPTPLDLWAHRIGGGAYRLYRRARSAMTPAPQQVGVALRDRQKAKDQDRDRERVSEVWAESPEAARNASWMNHPAVGVRLAVKATDRMDFDPYIHLKVKLSQEGWSFPAPRALSLGCGHGVLERALVGLGIAERLDGIDLSGGAIEEARRLAAEAGLSHQIEYHVADLEHAAFPQGAFDMVFAHHSMHHIEDLDGLCVAARRALRPGGILHLNEFVGPDRFQWTDAQLHHLNAFCEALPERYRRLASGQVRPPVLRPTIPQMIAADPSEAIRSSAIIETVRRHFRVVELRELGGALLHVGLTGIIHNFDPAVAEDNAHLQAFFDLEDRLMAESVIGSDFITLTAVSD